MTAGKIPSGHIGNVWISFFGDSSHQKLKAEPNGQLLSRLMQKALWAQAVAQRVPTQEAPVRPLPRKVARLLAFFAAENRRPVTVLPSRPRQQLGFRLFSRLVAATPSDRTLSVSPTFDTGSPSVTE